ncbi:hypothetical protein FQ085_11570 [Planococcus sp. ANT_H30]|uniref:hypothetical protein n=1 Tax=Planococcus sp. ANT_H30 TaxID=2597347 RepID=UPI0011F04F18|nr:hypothetical protein [Planococcus sp. ANT_H30]KAA0956625.1 hypothetical protein FQ085_11570 [Planococcus sp. ANT_H30]
MQSFTQFSPLTRQEITDAIHGATGSRELAFRYDLLDKNDQKIREITSIVDGQVEMNAFATIKRTAKFTIKDDGNINYLTDRIQPFARLKVKGEYIELPLGVFLLSSPTKEDENGIVFRDVDAYDGLLVLRDDKFENRYFIAAGTNYRDAVISILNGAGITKHNIEQTDKTLPNDKEFEPGKEKLYAINELLGAINFTTITHDVYGYYTSQYYRSPSTLAAEYTYKDDDLSILIPGMSEEMDTFSVANRFVAVLNDPEREPITAIFTNDSIDSPFSTVNRGRVIVDYREVEDIADEEALEAYIQRIAFNASQVYGKLEFATAINPFHDLSDVIQIEYSPLGINEKYSETSWRIPLRAGAEMEHSFRRVVDI